MTVLSRLAQRALTYQQIFNTAADLEWQPMSSAGIAVNQDVARNLLAVWACQRLLTNSISTMPVKVFRKAGDRRVPVGDPPWMKMPTGDENDTIVDHFADAVMSLLSDGNEFARGFPGISPATEALLVLPPDKVHIRPDNPRYEVRGEGRFSSAELIHISLLRKPGERRGMSPIDNALGSIGIGLAAQEFGARFFANGATLSGVIQLPPNTAMTPDALNNLRDSFAIKHQGVQKSHAVGILTNGATFKEMTSTPAESQLLELRKFTVEDIARLYGVPPHMIGSQDPGAVAYASVEQRSIDYVQNAVQPLAVKLETAYARLLPPDQYLKFNLAALLRGDLKTRFEAYQIALQNKFMTRDEIRAFEDMEPADDAKGVGSEFGGFLETPNNNGPQESPDASI